jgi:hypothetical protein
VGLPYTEFAALFPRVKDEALHLEMRDSYGTEAEIPHLAKWAAGESDDLRWLRPWCALVRDAITAGKVFRRARARSGVRSRMCPSPLAACGGMPVPVTAG